MFKEVAADQEQMRDFWQFLPQFMQVLEISAAFFSENMDCLYKCYKVSENA